MKRTLLPSAPAVGTLAAVQPVARIAKTPPGMVRAPGGELRDEVRDGQPVMVQFPDVNDDAHIGRRQVVAFANSDGDFQCSSTPRPGPRFGRKVIDPFNER